ncbi:MAG: hypothetical protein ONB55_22325 [candidate division KSB1 bacterium]|nr:hypothetical protein [candidate division KSB1 bacterium]
MPFSSGTFSRIYNWTVEQASPPIEIAKLDTQEEDFATGLSNCILRDGTGAPTAAISWNSQNLTAVGLLEAARFVPTGSTIPSNGLYLPSSNTVGLATASTLRFSINSTGNATLVAPSSGTALTLNSASAGVALATSDGTRSFRVQSPSNVEIGSFSNHALALISNSATRVTVHTNGRVTVASPTSADHALEVTSSAAAALRLIGNYDEVLRIQSRATVGSAYQTWFRLDGTTRKGYFGYGSATSNHLWVANEESDGQVIISTGGSDRVIVAPGGAVTVNTPTSGTTLTLGASSGGTNLDANAPELPRIVARTTSVELSMRAWESSGVGIFGTQTNHGLQIRTNDTSRIIVGAGGSVSVNSPSSGYTISINSLAGTQGLVVDAASSWGGILLRQAGTARWSLLHDYDASGEFSIYSHGTAASAVRITSARNVTVAGPTSGTALTVNGVSAGTAQTWSDGSRSASLSFAASRVDFGATTGDILSLLTSNTRRVEVASGGNVTVNTPSSGTTLTLNSVSGGVSLVATDGTRYFRVQSPAGVEVGTFSGHSLNLVANSATRMTLGTSGNISMAAPSTGVTLDVAGVSGYHSTTIADAAGTSGFKVGYLNIPQNSQSANYTCVLADAGKHIFHPSGAGSGDTFTIPANSSVAYDIGTTITFVNEDSNSVSIAIGGSDTLRLAGTTSTGTRTLGQYGVATAIKITSTSWIISGTGLT